MRTFLEIPLNERLLKDSDGFVLPYVLLVIAIIAIIGTIAADRLTETSGLMRSFDAFAEADLAFISAESQAMYSFLGGHPVAGGIEIGNVEISSTNDFLGIKSEAVDIWSAAGGTRIARTEFGPVYVELRDLAGLVSLNSAGPEELIPFLMMFGIEKTKAAGLTAKLEDYRDADHRRRFQGAERADYKLRGLGPPSNAPLRDYAELNSILQWSQALRSINKSDFQRLTTLNSRAGVINLEFAPSELASILSDNALLETARSEGDIFGSAISQRKIPSDRFRLTFTYISSNDVVWQRLIEIERKAGHPNKPFKRVWVFDRSFSGRSLSSIKFDELKNVVYASPNSAE